MRRLLLPLLVLTASLACGKVRETGPHSMIGRVLDANGDPVAGLDVTTIESETRTDDDGRFAVTYKEPSRWVSFTLDGLRYQRAYRPDDDGTVVEIRLPATERTGLGCEFAAPCEATLTWQLGDDLEATARATCDRDEAYVLDAAPAGLPSEVTCRNDVTGPDAPARAVAKNRGLIVTPPPVTLTIDLTTASSDLPSNCRVDVDGTTVPRTGAGSYAAQVFGHVQVDVWCDAIPAVPRKYYVREPASVTVDWMPDTPSIDIAPTLPWATSLSIAALEGRSRGWLLHVPVDNGQAVLPPLEPGVYAFAAGVDDERVMNMRPGEGLRPDVLLVRQVPESMRADPEVPEAIGMLVLLDPAKRRHEIPVQVMRDE